MKINRKTLNLNNEKNTPDIITDNFPEFHLINNFFEFQTKNDFNVVDQK